MATESLEQRTAGERERRGGGRETKHGELTAALREMLASMRPGDRLPTQEELMRRFQVSDTTVLRSLDALKREGRIVRRQGSGTFVAETPAARTGTDDFGGGVAAAPVHQQTGLVVVMTLPSDGPLFSDLLQAVESNLRRYDLAPVLVVDVDPEARVRRAREHWSRGGVLGAIHVGSARLPDLGDLPTILIGEADADHEHNQVSLDNAASGRLVGEYLWNLGHRRIAVARIGTPGQPRTEGVDHLRVAGIRALWEQRGGVWRDDWQIAHPFLLRLGGEERRSVDVMRSYLEPAFRCAEPPTAIFAVHDEMATVAIRALETMGLRVPDDVSVVGFNDSGTLAAYFRPSLTTVRTPSPALGALAVHLFQDLLSHPDQKPRSVRLPPELIVRESTAPPPFREGPPEEPSALPIPAFRNEF